MYAIDGPALHAIVHSSSSGNSSEDEWQAPVGSSTDGSPSTSRPMPRESSHGELVDAHEFLESYDDAERNLSVLPNMILLQVFAQLPARDRIASLPLVCRQFARLCGAGPLWLRLALPPCDGAAYRLWAEGRRMAFRASAMHWFRARGSGVEWLDLTMGRHGKNKSEEFLQDLGCAALPQCPNLKQLLVHGSAPAPLLELLPFCRDLRALQVDLLTGMDVRPASLDSLSTLHALRVLKLNWSAVVRFPHALLALTQLSALTVGAIESLPPCVSRLSGLTRFEMLSCIQRRTPAGLALLPNLAQLGLYANREGQPLELSDELSALTQLTCLWVADGRLGNTAVLGRLPRLKNCWLHTCSLGGLPRSLSSLTALERLIVLNDDVRLLPGWLSGLRSLASLSVLDNASTIHLTSEVTALTALTALRCNRRGCSDAPLLRFCADGGVPGVVFEHTPQTLVCDFRFCGAGGELDVALRCPPGTSAAVLAQGAAVFPFIARVLVPRRVQVA